MAVGRNELLVGGGGYNTNKRTPSCHLSAVALQYLSPCQVVFQPRETIATLLLTPHLTSIMGRVFRNFIVCNKTKYGYKGS